MEEGNSRYIIEQLQSSLKATLVPWNNSVMMLIQFSSQLLLRHLNDPIAKIQHRHNSIECLHPVFLPSRPTFVLSNTVGLCVIVGNFSLCQLGPQDYPPYSQTEVGWHLTKKINIFRTCIKIELSSLFVCKWQCEIRANMPRIIHARAPEKKQLPQQDGTVCHNVYRYKLNLHSRDISIYLNIAFR